MVWIPLEIEGAEDEKDSSTQVERGERGKDFEVSECFSMYRMN